MKNEIQLAVFIDSFDGYGDIWSGFFDIFNNYWPDCKYQRYLISNERVYSDNNLKMICTGGEISWFHRTITALETMNEDYILFMLEDYFISKVIDNKDIDEILDYVNENKLYFYKLSGCCKEKIKLKSVKVENSTYYPISLQMAVWNRLEFICILKDLFSKGATSPWDFEKFFVEKYKELPKDVLISGIEYDTRDIFGYKNGVLQGKWIRDTVTFYKKIGLNIDTNGRPVMNNFETLNYKMKVSLSQRIHGKAKIVLKRILMKLGFKFMS